MREISAETLNELATKIERLGLTVDEQAVMDKILERATDATAETVGFVASEDELIAAKGVHAAAMQGLAGGADKVIRPAGLSPFAIKLGGGAGLWP